MEQSTKVRRTGAQPTVGTTHTGPAIVQETPATNDETRAFLLSRAKRDFAVVLKTFVQVPAVKPHDPMQPRGAILSTFVNRGDLRGLQSYLFLSAIISNGDGDNGWSTTLPLSVWARVFGTTSTAEARSASSSASKILTRLVERKLIERHRTGRERKVTVTLLQPDGSGAPFGRQNDSGDVRPYIKLNNTFWTDGWHAKLDLPATAMLLVALQENPSGFKLPSARMKLWYGWSPDSAERGLKTLVDFGLIEKSYVLEKAPLSPTGLTRTNFYKVLAPFRKAEPTKKIQHSKTGTVMPNTLTRTTKDT